MVKFRTGCLVCGKPLQYFDTTKMLRCEMCGELYETTAACMDEHYICDKCHTQKGFEFITQYALQTESKNPFSIATGMMKNAYVNMHGPEHHYLVAAALLSAYKNARDNVDLATCLGKALKRAKNVPGGVCGAWGSCGAGISTGIFISVITSATPLSEKEWNLSNAMTSRSLEGIAKNGGPRCCKRNTYLAIKSAVLFVREHMAIEMEHEDNIQCVFFHMNEQCRKTACPFWHVRLENL